LSGPEVTVLRRIYLAFVCFFRVLLGRPLPAGLLTEGAPAKTQEPPRGPSPRDGAVALLALLQRDGRLIDFLLEDVDGYSDEQVGAAVRDVHRGCRKAILEHVEMAPVVPETEGARVTVAKGFDPGEIRLTGAVAGEPPFAGTLRHPGWKVAKVDLPKSADGIVAPAEVEL
jgi:hypothetical protein